MEQYYLKESIFVNQSVRTFIHKISAQFFVQALLALRAFAILPIITKTLGSYNYGIWSQISIMLVQFVPVLTLRFDVTFVRYFASVQERAVIKKVFSSMLILILFVLFVFSFLTVVLSKQMTQLIFKQTDLQQYVFILLALLVVRTIFLFSQSYYRAEYQIGRYSIIQSLLILGDLLVLFLTIVIFKKTLSQALIVLVYFDLIVMIITLSSVLRKTGIVLPSFRYLKPYLLYSLPLVPNVGLLWIINFSDRFFITKYFDLKDVGIYAASFSLGQLLILFVTPIGFVLYPKISKLWEEKQNTEISFWVENSIKYFLFLAIPAIIGIWYFSPFILSKLATEEFIQYRFLIPFIATGLLFFSLCQFYTYLIHLFEKTTWILYIFLIIALEKIFLNVFLVPVIGVTGAAVATFFSYMTQFILIYFVTRRKFSIKISNNFIIKVLLCTLIMSAFIYLFKPDSIVKNILLLLLGVLVYLGAMFVTKGVGKKEKDVFFDFIKNFTFRVK